MSETFEAIFENGSFKPVDNGSMSLSEGQRVKLTVDVSQTKEADALQLARAVYQDLSPDEVNAVERIALDRDDFFRDRSS